LARSGGQVAGGGQVCRAAALEFPRSDADHLLLAEDSANGSSTLALKSLWDNGRFRGDYGDFYRTIKARMAGVQAEQTLCSSYDGPRALGFEDQRPFSINSGDTMNSTMTIPEIPWQWGVRKPPARS
jgi:hypothetical protein